MDDVFNSEISDVHSELEVGSRDWERRSEEVYSAGIREGYFAKSDVVLQKEFDIGVDQGFASTFELAVLKGRLSVRLYYSTGEKHLKIKNLVKSIDEKEKQLISLGSIEKDLTYQQLVHEAEILLKS
ncbi:unnamed protein product [Schistosoma rodhaini]|uniref:Yae1_N domain-containing protein n=2 Tax=Schistosoma TaxID=6181 RepID=G4VBF8_SCHMA|nr:hypothetical protein Smp_179080 [Schistosoma mansoni]CAH8509359.1 unnamed protein product [Schistosoma rodhaini]CAH8526959.1 unnamed protein product [Schistosoma rodhaini]|eukprot:XP_018649856.1 hypothetical protein Smp_179080 [Schistosoma mansoni]